MAETAVHQQPRFRGWLPVAGGLPFKGRAPHNLDVLGQGALKGLRAHPSRPVVAMEDTRSGVTRLAPAKPGTV